MAHTQLLQINLIELLEIEDFPEEKKYELIEKSVDLVQKRVFLRVLDTLSADKKDALLKLLEQEGAADERASFLETHCPQFFEWLEEEIVKVKAEMRVIVARLKGLEEKVEDWVDDSAGKTVVRAQKIAT
ncbi:hypothetical protein HY839_04810 [Candidatus Azambacteria bacterium]|nr:hypothetical protein [Candidatus Azambacteria bacterium]